MSNTSMVQVSRLANILRTGDPKTPVFKNAIADALIELDTRSVDPRVKAERIISGTISSAVTVNAASLIGVVEGGSGLIVNASAITGLIDASQIGSVNTTSFVGTITASQIFSVNATSITGVVVSSQLADGIIDSLNKFSAPLRDIPTLAAAPTLPNPEYPAGTFYYNTTSSTFFENVAGTWTATTEGAAIAGKVTYYFVGKINVNSFIGLISAAQIGSVNASTITGTITSGGPVIVQAGAISGTITSGGPVTIEVGSLTGTINSGGPVAINGGVIQNLTIAGGKLEDASITEAKIASLAVTNAKIGSVAVDKISIGGTATITGDVQIGATGFIQFVNGSRAIRADATKILIQADSSAKAEFTATALTFTRGTAVTEISAGGVQIYGGTTGIGIGAATFASSPLQITSSQILLTISPTRQMSIDGLGMSVQGNFAVNGGDILNNTGWIRGTNEVGAYSGGTSAVLMSSGSPGVFINGGRVLAAQQSAVDNATVDLNNVVTQFNTLLSRLRTHGLIAT